MSDADPRVVAAASPPSKDIEEAVGHSDAHSEHAKDEDRLRAKMATDREHALGWSQSLRLYPKAIMFSIIFSTAIIMEGYDLAMIGGFYGYPA